MTEALDALTDKEKDTLRLIVRGHDAKSAASELDLSVHTINERLRQARRKLDVTSSREAARLLLESEEAPPESLAYKALGDASMPSPTDPSATAPRNRRALWIGGIAMFSVLLLTLALTNQPGSAPAQAEGHVVAILTPTSASNADVQREAAARQWLGLVDRSDWQASFDAAGSQFQTRNTVAGWQAASEQARVPLGAMISREVVEIEAVNAPPSGYIVVKFLTAFEARSAAIETVTLEREEGALRMVGYVID